MLNRLIFLFLLVFIQLHGRENQKYNFALRAETITENKLLKVIIPSYCNEDYVDKCLSSILTQDYDNYHIYYVDDASPDGTSEAVCRFMEEHNCHDKITLIRNEENHKALYNIFMVTHTYCEPSDVVLVIDGDDWLAHTHVFSDYNAFYNDPHVWTTYGTHLKIPGNHVVPTLPPLRKDLINGTLRKNKRFVMGQLRSYYAGLFHHIDPRDLMHEDQLFPVLYDIAMMMPMVEMAREHSYMVTDINYVHNAATNLNDNTVNYDKMRFFLKLFQRLKVYPRLLHHPSTPLAESENDRADLVCICPSLDEIGTTLLYLAENVSPLSSIHLIYDTKQFCEFEDLAYLSSIKNIPVHFHPIKFRSEPLQKTIEAISRKSRSKYLLITNSNTELLRPISLHKAMEKMEAILGYACFYNIDSQLFIDMECPSNELIPISEELFFRKMGMKVEFLPEKLLLNFVLFSKKHFEGGRELNLTLDDYATPINPLRGQFMLFTKQIAAFCEEAP